MKVSSKQHPEDQPFTKPFPLRNGVFVALRSGDFYSPDSWDITKVTRYKRDIVKNRPFLSLRCGHFGFYIGWKVFGVDTDNQRAMPGINPEDVYVGSVAIQGFTMRFSRNVS